ncbi:hypothetical protein BSKO_07843 [Bryopsis sp. KO-2023]|nr:hypothetical protein BSKO_07843 [Bryopsis sp. KO-2023]
MMAAMHGVDIGTKPSLAPIPIRSYGPSGTRASIGRCSIKTHPHLRRHERAFSAVCYSTNAVETQTETVVPGADQNRSLVVAVDDTDDSVRALEWTVNNVYRGGDSLHLLHVVPFIHRRTVPSAVYYTPPVDPGLQEQLTETAEVVINERFTPVLTDLGVGCKVDIISEGSNETIAEAVCDGAVGLGASMVVVAAHKRHWLASWLAGSKSTEVAKKAPIPVIVFHG